MIITKKRLPLKYFLVSVLSSVGFFIFVFLESFCLIAFLCYGKDPVIIHYCSLLWTSRPFYVAVCSFFSHPHVPKLLIWSLVMFPLFLSVMRSFCFCSLKIVLRALLGCMLWDFWMQMPHLNLQTFYRFNWQRSVWEIARISSCRLTAVDKDCS